MKTTVLIVDDEKSLRDFIGRNLDVRGFRAITAADGLEALAIFNTEDIDLVILDLMMPHMNGLETLRRVRLSSLVPVIILSALGEEAEKVKAFDLGADDYLTKPFGVKELLARIQAVLRRAKWSRRPERRGRLVCGDLVADLERHEVLLHGDVLELTPTEFELLTYLMENAGRVLPHRTILQNVWGAEYGDETEYLRVYIGRLRSKIEIDPSTPRSLLTERGVGYLFEER